MIGNSQSGQALVGALVTTVLLFALAGGLATAVSATLSQQRGGASPFLQDLKGESTINALAAAVAGGSCPTGGLGEGGELTGYSCHQIPLIRPVSPGAAILGVDSANCSVAPLATGGHVSVWLNVSKPGNSLYVDGTASGCRGGTRGPCSGEDSSPLLLIRDCDLSTIPTPHVHLVGPAGPSVVRYAAAAALVSGPGSPLALGGQVIASAVGHFHRATPPIADLAAAMRSDAGDFLQLLLGNGDGSFRKGSSRAAEGPIGAIVVGDFNGDGVDDIAYTWTAGDDDDPSFVTVLLGNGDGAFDPMQDSPFPVGAGAVGLVAAHFRLGDQLDLAVANRDSNTISLLLSGRNDRGGPTFATREFNRLGLNAPTALVAPSLRSNGRADLVVANSGSNRVTVLFSDGSGGFGDPQNYRVDSQPNALVAADFNGDGHVDVAVANQGSGTLSVLMGSGGGALGPRVTTSIGGRPSGLAVGTFAGGSNPGLAVLMADTDSVLPLVGDGAGHFAPAVGGAIRVGGSAAGLVTGPFMGGSAADSFAAAGDGGLSVLVPNRQRIFSLVAQGASGTASQDEADLLFGADNVAQLRYEGGL